ncbi:MAG: hypothetical protein ACTSXU_14630 [Promethearchaeota archaeon]
MGASGIKVLIYIIGAGALIGITYGFFWGLGQLNSFLGTFYLKTYSTTVWAMTGVLAGMIIFSALAKDHARLEMLSSASFLIYYILAYTIGCSILSFYIPYVGFGQLDVEFLADLSTVVPGMGDVNVQLIIANNVAAILIVAGQGLKFLNTFVKSMKKFKKE